MKAPTIETPIDVVRVFELQQINRQRIRNTTAAERIAKLKRLRKALMAHRADIEAALWADFRKAPAEVTASEIIPVLGEIKTAVNHLKRWMKPARAKTPLAFAGTSVKIHYEPKGVVLIISPWNYPVNLTFGPLVSAIAAGNCAILKPSEFTPHTSHLMAHMTADLFDEHEVALFEGGHHMAQALLEHPFDHIFFTGSPAVGKLIMQAAAKHLASVTLELGGKSPTIVDETADPDEAAQKIVAGKFTNCGQTCIAPDYLYVQEKRYDELIEALKRNLEAAYGTIDASLEENPDFARIVNDQHFERIRDLYASAVEAGASVMIGGEIKPETRFIAPVLLTNVPPGADIMQEEIFGPVLPVFKYQSLDDVLRVINGKEKPLTPLVTS